MEVEEEGIESNNGMNFTELIYFLLGSSFQESTFSLPNGIRRPIHKVLTLAFKRRDWEAQLRSSALPEFPKSQLHNVFSDVFMCRTCFMGELSWRRGKPKLNFIRKII